MAPPCSRRSFLRASLAATAGALVAGGPEVAQAGEVEGGPVEPPPAGAAGWSEQVQVRTTVNGVSRELVVRGDESALEVLRERLGLNGARQVCGQGACGACAVTLDGVPVASCLLPAVALHGAAVGTVEGLGAERLHPVQRAFMAEDALQCGFCTPGFVVEASAFHDRWRATHGVEVPPREEVALALAGHLCRCGAYDGIYRAVQGACSGRFDADDPVPPRLEARAKVTGEATYTVDLRLPGMLEAVVLRAWRAPGKVVRLDVEAARALPGVRAIHVFAPADSPLRYAGQEIVAIAAEDARSAREALGAVSLSVDYTAPVVGLDAGRRADAPRVYRDKDEGNTAPAATEGFAFRARWEGNIRGPVASHFFSSPGKAVIALDELAASGKGTIIEETWRTHTQCHTPFEPRAVVASWESPSRLTVHLSTQSCDAVADDIAEHYGLPRENVRVLCPNVGGGFGSKVGLDNTAVAAIELARVAGAPVRLVLPRADELAVGGNRPAHEIQLVMGMDGGGHFVGLRSSSWADGGVAVGNNANLLLRLMYPHQDKELLDYDVVTHAAPAKPFRGPGGPPGLWALEQSVDEIAARRGEDPVAVRRRMDPNPVRARLYDAVERLPMWQERGPIHRDRGRFRAGVGLAAVCWPYFVEVATQVGLQVDPEGRFKAASAVQDMGQGCRTVLAEAVAGVLGVDKKDIEIEIGDSALPRGPVSAGSRTTASLGVAAEDAARQLRDALVEVATAQGLRGATAAPGGVRFEGGFKPWRELARGLGRAQVVGRRRPDDGGYFLPLRVQGLAVGKALGAGVLLVEVEVDARLGRVRPRRVWGGFGVGRRIAPALADSQAQGGILQGLSYALYEDRRLDPRHASLLSAGLEDYRLLGIADAPEITLHWEEAGFEHTRLGGIGLGELVTVGVAAALGNAVHHATGWRPTRLPLRHDVVLEGLSR